MKHHIIGAGIVLAWLVTGAFGPPPPPTPHTLNTLASAHSVTTNNFCSFPMQVDVFGQTMVHTQYDSTGRLVKMLATMSQGRMTFTNLNTKKSVWTPTAGVFTSKTNPDGGLTFGWSGIKARIVVPGQGLVLADLGTVTWTLKYDAQGKLTFKLTQGGIQQGVVPPSLCGVLD